MTRSAALAPFVFIVAAAALRGTVLDAATDRAVPGARVEALSTRAAAATDQAGGFVIEAPAFPLELAVSRTGYRVARLALAAEPSRPLVVRLEPVISIADRVEVTAARAREGTDPVTLTNVPQERVAETYWGQDPAIVLSETVPGYFAYNDSGNGIGYSYYWIRGFNQAQTRMTLNGAPLNDAEDGELYFIDLADFMATAGDVQMQRGVYGLSGIGGTVDITTANPAMEPRFSFTSGFGSFGTQRLSTTWDSGLIDGRWAVSARYSKITTDGYRDRSWVDMWNTYMTLAHFAESSRWRLVVFGGPEQTHLAYEGVPKSVLDGGLTGDPDRDRRFNPLTYPGEQDNFTQRHAQLVHELAASPATVLDETFFVFTGSGFYDEYKTDRVLAEYNLPDAVLPDGTVVTSSDLVRRRQVDEWDAGWVPTLSTTSGDWTFTLKGEARFHSGHHFGEVKWAQTYPEGVPPDRVYYDYRAGKRSASLSVAATWRAADRLTVTAAVEGARHTYALSHDRLKGFSFTQSYDFLMPRLGAVWRLAEGTEIYANAARGMKEPAFREIYDPEDYYGEFASLKPQDVWDWEAGVSARRGSWRLRANLFFMNFPNEIVYSGALDSSGVPIYGNGAHSHHEGLELDATFQPRPALGFDANLSLARNTFVRYHELVDPEHANVYDGNRLAGYPDVLASLTARTQTGPVALAATGRWVGRFYVDNTQDNRRDPQARQQPGYVPLVNPGSFVLDLVARGSLPQRRLRALGIASAGVELRLNNALDRRYTAFGYAGDDGGPVFIPAATRNVYVGFTLEL